MIKEILFVHHTHTDIGYTHPQPVVFELHRRFIDEALDIADATRDVTDESRFKWTCEVTGITEDWWRRASNTDRDRFLAAVERGQFEVAAMGWHMTPLMDHGMLLDVLRPVRFFRDLGIPVRSGMNTDVNGMPWGTVDALLDHGITGLSMAINEHFGHALRPWPRAFRWQAPSGRVLHAYNGFIYGVTSDRNIRVPMNMDEAQQRVPAWAKLWEDRGYPHSFLMMQITSIRYHDNGSPQAALPAFIKAFNDRDPTVRLRFVTLSEFFDRVRAEPEETLPLMRGDWTDWWNFGSGSTAHETAQLLQGQRHLDDALGLDAWTKPDSPRHDDLVEESRRSLALFAEHTWGADRSVSHPYSPETRTQQLLKLQYAPHGASLARMLRRDGLERLATKAGGEEPTVLVYNPHPFPVRQPLKLPYLPPLAGAPDPMRGFGLEDLVPTGPTSHRIQRQDVVLSDLSDDRAYWSAPVEVPGMSFITIPAADLKPAAANGLAASNVGLTNGVLSVVVDDKTGGITSLVIDGAEYVRNGGEPERFGVPVFERPEANDRDAIYARIDVESPDWYSFWDTKWKAVREAGRLTDTNAVVDKGRAEVRQTFTLSAGDTVTVIYRLTPEARVIEVETLIDKVPNPLPHGIFLPMPVALADRWCAHFETAGAVVMLDDEQLPYASRGYITTQRWMRIDDGTHEVTVACPDTPLWQVGGYTYGRHGDPDGRVPRERPMLLAWLTNNYWMTNFQADQGGRIRHRFAVIPAAARPLGASAREALAHARPLAAHVFAERGTSKLTSGTLLDADLGNLILTRIENTGSGVALTLLNPDDADGEAKVGAGTVTPTRAWIASLSGERREEIAVAGGAFGVHVPARAWLRVEVETAG